MTADWIASVSLMCDSNDNTAMNIRYLPTSSSFLSIATRFLSFSARSGSNADVGSSKKKT